MDIWLEFASAIWILIPAYAANGFALLACGRLPLDLGKNFIDNRRLFGDNKTVEGFAIGIAAGTLYGAIESAIAPALNAYAGLWGVSLPSMSLLIGFMIALGAMVGDLVGSFIKRRLGMKPGAHLPGLDQLDFVIGAIAFSAAFTQISLVMVVIMLVLTLFVHRFACILGYALGFKKVPW